MDGGPLRFRTATCGGVSSNGSISSAGEGGGGASSGGEDDAVGGDADRDGAVAEGGVFGHAEGQGGDELFFDQALEGSGAVAAVEAMVGEPGSGVGGDVEREVAAEEAAAGGALFELEVDDVDDV